jgi:hypothetical protein
MLHKKVRRKIELNLNRVDQNSLIKITFELLTESTFYFGTIEILSHLVSSISIPLKHLYTMGTALWDHK